MQRPHVNSYVPVKRVQETLGSRIADSSDAAQISIARVTTFDLSTAQNESIAQYNQGSVMLCVI